MLNWFKTAFGNSEEARLLRAQQFISQGRYNDARLELIELEGEHIEPLRQEALNALISINLERAVALFNLGDTKRARVHLEQARTFGATTEQLRQTRNYGRQQQQQRQQEAQKIRAEKNKVEIVGTDPLWSLPPDHPHVRYAMKIESYPEHLQKRLIELGSDFAEATLLIEDGNPNEAFERLSPFVETEPAARFERARAAIQANRAEAAISDLYLFGEEVGHCEIDSNHSAAILGRLLGQLNRATEALSNPDLLTNAHPSLKMVKAELLEQQGDLDGAEVIVMDLLRLYPQDLSLIRKLGTVRVRKGDRMGATHVLEAGLKRCCTPGNCGSQPFDIYSARLLVRIYLEDRIDPTRAKELLKDIQKHTKDVTWEDQYLSALYARNQAHPFTAQEIKQLMAPLGPNDPRRGWITEQFKSYLQ